MLPPEAAQKSPRQRIPAAYTSGLSTGSSEEAHTVSRSDGPLYTLSHRAFIVESPPLRDYTHVTELAIKTWFPTFPEAAQGII